MSGFAVKADSFQKKLIKTLGRGLMNEELVDPSFEKVLAMAEAAGATYARKHIVKFVGEVDGQRKASAAEAFFVRFGQGAEAAWVAFCVFEGGWANTYRPLTPATATMAWLDAYVTKELVG